MSDSTLGSGDPLFCLVRLCGRAFFILLFKGTEGGMSSSASATLLFRVRLFGLFGCSAAAVLDDRWTLESIFMCGLSLLRDREDSSDFILTISAEAVISFSLV